MCVCVISVIAKHPVLPLCAVDGRCRNPIYYYYYSDLSSHSQNRWWQATGQLGHSAQCCAASPAVTCKT